MPSQKLFSPIEPEGEPEPRLWFGETLSQPPLWRSLLDNLRERMFSPPLPPPPSPTLQPILTSQTESPFHYGKRSAALSLALHAAALGALFGLSLAGARLVTKPAPTVSLVEPPVSSYVLHASKLPGRSGGGGGGGDRDKLPAPKGRLPKVAMIQLAPPAVVVRNEKPKLPVEPTVVAAPEMPLPQSAALNLGDTISGVPGGPPSNGTGTGGGIGSGSGGGVGSGTGPGVGPGHGGGFGGGVFRVGGGVTAPRVIEDPKPEYSDEARKAKFEGTVVLWLIVDSSGRPRDLRVARSLGMGLDQKALEAVRLWKFKPAMKDGSPVSVEVNVEVNFHLY